MIVQWLYRTIVVGALVLLPFGSSEAVDETLSFSSEDQRERYIVLLDELRCPQCQNQNLLDSDAPLAKDLRGTVYRLLQEDMSNQEITEYLIGRYGDFITYMPRFKSTTWMLWLTPLVLLLFALAFLPILLRKQRQQAIDTELSVEEQRQLEQLLNGASESDKDADSQ